MSSNLAPGPATACLTFWDEEGFWGRRCRLLSDFANVSERGSLLGARFVKVEDGRVSDHRLWLGWVAYQYPGYRGYQYVLEQDWHNGEFHNYSEFVTQAHTGQLQSIWRVQQ